MVRILAKIKLFSGPQKRQTGFKSGYRPLFNVLDKGEKTSGMITLLDREIFLPEEEAIVEIKFVNAQCTVNTKFYFYENIEPLGEGRVLKILEEN